MLARCRANRAIRATALMLTAAASLVVSSGADEVERDAIVRVVLETALGDVEVAVYPSHAPISASNFLAYVDGGHYDGALYRAWNREPHLPSSSSI